MVNSCETPINAVIENKPKVLIGLDQTVGGQAPGLRTPRAQMPHHRRRGATSPTQVHRRNVVSP